VIIPQSRVLNPPLSAAVLVLISCYGFLLVRRTTLDLSLPVKSHGGREAAVSATVRPPNPHVPVTRFDGTIEAAAVEYRLDPLLLKAMIAVESGFNDRCVSRAGACGLMQLLPSTARRLAIQNIFDPQNNIHGGARHFRYLLNTFSNDIPRSLAAYNAGERPVIRYRGIPPYPETQKYVVRVMKIYNSYRS
jgi:soluble lytic murein transglycosylase-like protein